MIGLAKFWILIDNNCGKSFHSYLDIPTLKLMFTILGSSVFTMEGFLFFMLSSTYFDKCLLCIGINNFLFFSIEKLSFTQVVQTIKGFKFTGLNVVYVGAVMLIIFDMVIFFVLYRVFDC